jgi:hypothetical protein
MIIKQVDCVCDLYNTVCDLYNTVCDLYNTVCDLYNTVCDLYNTVSLHSFIDCFVTLTKPTKAHKRIKVSYVMNIVYLLQVSATCGHSQ